MNRIEIFKRPVILGLILLSGLTEISAPKLFASNSDEKQFSNSSSSADELAFVTKPYLQYPVADAMTVMWITNNNCHSWVEYGLTEDDMTSKAQASINGLIQANCRINRIRLEHLIPNTTYYYKVCSREIIDFQAYSMEFGETIISDTYSFATPKADNAEVNSVIFNDIHNVDGMFEKLLKYVKNFDYDFVFLNGDMENDLKDEDRLIHMLTNLTNSFATTKPFLNSVGNHEKRGAYARVLQDYITFPDERKTYYTYSRGPVFFIVLDTGEDKADTSSAYYSLVDSEEYRRSQVTWLEEQLQSEARKAAKYTVVFMHIPPFYSGSYASTQCGELFNPLFNQYNIDLVISGHTHEKGLYYPDESTIHHYPILIGGGKEAGNRTIIKLSATEENLTAQLINEIGLDDFNFNAKPRTPSSLNEKKETSLHIEVNDSNLTIKGPEQNKEYVVRIYALSGALMLEKNIISSGNVDISCLPISTYVLSVLDKHSKKYVGNAKFQKSRNL